MKEQSIITLDLTGCKYLGELHERIKIAFNFQECYGANWDAFYDFLRSECTADKVVVTGEKTLSKEFEKELAVMHRVLEDFKNNRSDYYDAIEYKIID